MKTVYEIMHGNRKVAWIDTQGRCKIYYKSFMPFSLYLEETENDIDTLVNNITNFYHWCASRILTLRPSVCEGNLKQYWCFAGIYR